VWAVNRKKKLVRAFSGFFKACEKLFLISVDKLVICVKKI
jgi:hypothetical protein